jgi:hypothetical protein
MRVQLGRDLRMMENSTGCGRSCRCGAQAQGGVGGVLVSCALTADQCVVHEGGEDRCVLTNKMLVVAAVHWVEDKDKSV